MEAAVVSNPMRAGWLWRQPVATVLEMEIGPPVETGGPVSIVITPFSAVAGGCGD